VIGRSLVFGRNWVMEDGTVPVKNRSDSPVEKKSLRLCISNLTELPLSDGS
jgi:hypothetical protein